MKNLKTIKLFAVFCFLMASPGFAFTAHAQCLTGTTGLVTIPTARMQDDGDLSFGISYFDKNRIIPGETIMLLLFTQA